MTAVGQAKHDVGRGVMLWFALSLIATILATAFTVATASDASAAVPGAAPANPTAPCTWNWNRWSQPDSFTFPYDDTSFDPTQAVFSQVPTALGTNGWYEASSAPQFNYAGLKGGPSEQTTGPKDREWTYGVGFYVLEPNSRQSITISDGGRQESHAIAFFNSAGEQFGRYPSMSDVRRGLHYVASEQEAKSEPSNGGGVGLGKAWSTTVSINIPADGIVYIHYLNFDERIRAQFATFGGACGPITVDDESLDNVPGRAASVDVAANDSNVSARSVSIVGADAATGALAVPGEGTWSVSSTGAITFTPEGQFVGSPKPIRYVATDSSGKNARPAQVTVTYQAVFSRADVSNGNTAGEVVTINLTANDSNVVPSTVSILGDLVDPGRGAWSHSNGTISFTPEPGYLGDPVPLSYTVFDAAGNQLPAVSIAVTYAPTPENDESLGNIPGDPVRIDVIGNDPAGDIDPATVAIVGEAAIAGEGLWTVDSETHEIVFTPEPSFAGDPGVRTYTVADFSGNVSPPGELVVDYLPVTRDDETSGHPAGAIITIDVLENDPSNDLDPALLAIDDPNYDRGTRTLVIPGEGVWSVDAVTGAITVTPQSGFLGDPVPIRYVVEDDDGNVSQSAELKILHLPLPVAAPDESVDNTMGETVTIDVLKNDPTRELDPATVQIFGADETGVLVVPGEGRWSVNPETGAISFDPKIKFDQNPTPITYIAIDELGVKVLPASVTVKYRGVIPEALAFIAPSDIEWWPVLWRGAIVGLLFITLIALSFVGGRQRFSGSYA